MFRLGAEQPYSVAHTHDVSILAARLHKPAAMNVFGGFGGGSAASASQESKAGNAAAPGAAAATSTVDSRDSLYSFDEAKLDSIRKTKPWTQE